VVEGIAIQDLMSRGRFEAPDRIDAKENVAPSKTHSEANDDHHEMVRTWSRKSIAEFHIPVVI